jgi:GH15 family glucan-1,4-alpha-glucosidase
VNTDPDNPLAIEDYALIGDCTTAALVGANGSIDWLCWPRFDSGACFAALLGHSKHGRWSISPADAVATCTRTYVKDTVVLETLLESADGCVALIDFMPVNQAASSVIRIVEGRRGRVSMRMNLTLRFDYGSLVPWVYRLEEGDGNIAIAGPNLVVLRTSVALRGEGLSTAADFDIEPQQRIAFTLSYGLSHQPPPPAVDCEAALQ